jgi:hypothetical protein
MKLPFEFNIKLIFRLIFPGAILAAAIVPAIYAILQASGIGIRLEYLYPLEVIACGWAVIVSDMHIYMLFEGRRYWPDWIRRLFVSFQKRRLRKLSTLLEKPSIDRRRFLEAGVEYSLYPVDEGGDAYVSHPTRLGNVIDAFETYPMVKYGLDSVFYWFRLWVVLDKDLREEIDMAQSIADSAVYITFVLYLSGLIMLAYACFALTPDWLHRVQLPFLPGPLETTAIGITCFIIGFLIYRLSLPAHVQFGELFKSIFDQYRSKLNFDDVVHEVYNIMGCTDSPSKTQREKNQIVWRYLRWHLIRDDSLRRNLTVKEWRDRLQPTERQHTGP